MYFSQKSIKLMFWDVFGSPGWTLGPWGPLGLGGPWALGTLGPWGPLGLGDPWALGTLGLGGPWALVCQGGLQNSKT